MTKRNKNSVGKTSAVRAVLLIAAVVLIVVLAVLGLYMLGMREPKGDGGNDTPVVSDPFAEIANRLVNGKTDGFEKVEMPDMTAADTFASFRPKTSYYQECTVTRSDGDVKTEQTKHILRDGEQYNIKTYEGGKLIETIICDGEKTLVRNEVTGNTSVLPRESTFTVSELASVPDHEKVTALADSYKNESTRASSELSKCSMMMYRTLDMNLMIMSLNFKETGAAERYYYYLDYEMIYYCETVLGGTQVYSLSTTAFNADITSLIREDTFRTE